MLPFLTTGAIKRQGGGAVVGFEAVPLSIWPTSRGVNRKTGETYDHEGEADISAADELVQPNRRLAIAGKSYTVIDAVPQRLGLQHVALTLRELAPPSGA